MHRSFGNATRALAFAVAAAAWIAAGSARAEEEETESTDGQIVERDPGPAPSPAAAEMLESMREKGLLTEDEYQELYRRQAKYEAEHADPLPGWLRDWTFGGDMRLRVERTSFGALDFDQTYELGGDNVDVINLQGRGNEARALLRLRLGAEKKVLESLTFGFRIATTVEESWGEYFNTGGVSFETDFAADPRRVNVPLGDFFSPKSIGLDRAYVRWQPDFAPTLFVTAGKFGNPFVSPYFPDVLVWDNDIQPEGIAAQYRFDFVPDEFWMETTSAFFTVQEQNIITLSGFDASTGEVDPSLPDIDDQNPFVIAVQGGFYAQPEPWIRPGVRISYYDMQHIGTRLAAAMQDFGNGGAAIDRNPLYRLLGPTNPLYEDGSSQGRTQELVVDGSVRLTPWGDRWSITPFAQWMSILNADSENNGWSAGVQLGSMDFLQLTVMYASVPRNATISVFTDTQMFGGFTNAQGWMVSAERELWRGVRVRGAYFRSEQKRDECDLASTSLALCDSASQISVLGPFRETTLERSRWQLDFMVEF